MSDRAFRIGSVLVLAALIASRVGALEGGTWVLETVPVMIALPVVWATRRRAPLTRLLYAAIALHCLVLMIGGHYTYAKVPFGFWLQDAFGFARNHYDRIGHFMQGFVPALIAREVLRRTTPLQPGRLLAFLCIAVAMFVSASYEIIEMIAGMLGGDDAEAFLGTQGDAWDTPMDMTMALIGAIVAMLSVSRWHERELERLATSRAAGASSIR